MLDRVLYVPMFVVNEFPHGFHKTIWCTTKSVKIKLYVTSFLNKSLLMRLGYYGLRKDNKRSVIMENVAITIQRALNKTSWLLFMDGVQLPQG